MQHTTREGWLMAAIDAFRPLFDAQGSPLPPIVRVSIGWPKGSNKAIGQCWYEDASTDSLRHIFISPVLSETASPSGILSTLIHECVHAALPMKVGHRKPFARLAGALGLVKPWKATTASPDLQAQLGEVARQLGEYPHGSLNHMKRQKEQKNRHLKIQCAEGCDYHLRGSATMLAVAIPRCPICDGPMVLESEIEKKIAGDE